MAGVAALFTAYYSGRLLNLSFLSRTNVVCGSSILEPGCQMIFPLVCLSFGSIFAGFLLKEVILSDLLPPFVPWYVKILPFLLGGFGFTLGLIWPTGWPKTYLAQAIFSNSSA